MFRLCFQYSAQFLRGRRNTLTRYARAMPTINNAGVTAAEITFIGFVAPEGEVLLSNTGRVAMIDVFDSVSAWRE